MWKVFCIESHHFELKIDNPKYFSILPKVTGALYFTAVTVYNDILRTQVKHGNLSHTSLNLFVGKHLTRFHEDASFVCQNKFNECFKYYWLNIAICRECFQTLARIFINDSCSTATLEKKL